MIKTVIWSDTNYTIAARLITPHSEKAILRAMDFAAEIWYNDTDPVAGCWPLPEYVMETLGETGVAVISWDVKIENTADPYGLWEE